MHATPIDPAEIRAGRRELKGVCALFAAACVVLVLAARGTFSSMMHFPHVFGVIVVLVALFSLRTARRVAFRSRLGVTLALIAVVVAAPAVHLRGIDRQLRERERAGMVALGGRPAPAIPYVEALGPAPGAAGELRFGDQVTLVNFWADWCGACVAELPELQAFWEANRGEGVDLIGVTKLYEPAPDPAAVRAGVESIREFLAGREIDFPMVVAASASPAHRDYLVAGLPTTVLIDIDGNVAGVGAGVSGTRRLMEQALALARKPGNR